MADREKARKSLLADKINRLSIFSKRNSVSYTPTSFRSTLDKFRNGHKESWATGRIVMAGKFYERFQEDSASLLGEGGSGEVYKNFDHQSGKWVALKLVKDEDKFEEAKREIANYQKLEQLVFPSRYITRMLDHFAYEDNRNGFIGKGMVMVMELGQVNLHSLISLAHRVDTFRFNMMHLSIIAKSVVNALLQIHSVGMIHMDIKPSNILITSKGEVKVFDLGSAIIRTKVKTSSTVFYAAPEITLTTNPTPPVSLLGYSEGHVLKDFEQAKKADIWSLGMTLLHLLTLENPFYDGCQLENTQDSVQAVKDELGRLFNDSKNVGSTDKLHINKSFLHYVLSEESQIRRPKIYRNFHNTLSNSFKELMIENGESVRRVFMLQDFLNKCLMVERKFRKSAFYLSHHEFLKLSLEMRSMSVTNRKSTRRKRLFLLKSKNNELAYEAKKNAKSYESELQVIKSLLSDYSQKKQAYLDKKYPKEE